MTSDLSLGTTRVHCNVIYNEYIQNKEHVHMNATRVCFVDCNYVMILYTLF